MEIGKYFCGRTDVRKDDTPEFQSTRSSPGDDLKTEMLRRNGSVIKSLETVLSHNEGMHQCLCCSRRQRLSVSDASELSTVMWSLDCLSEHS